MCCLFFEDVLCQNGKQKANVQREEVQRYFGYEELLPAYLTLPVDSSLNTNERGYFVEIGYIFLILIPICLLLRLRNSNKIFSVFLMVTFFLLSCLYISTSFILGDQYQRVTHGKISNYTSTNNSSLEDLLGQFYISLNYVGEFLLASVSGITSTSDYATYPILIILLLSFTFVFNKLELSKKSKRIVFLTLIFAFFWLILSSGIPWYGFLLIPLMLILIINFIQKTETRIVKVFAYSIIISSIFLSICNRISFVTISPNFDKINSGKYIVNQIFFNRSMGIMDDTNLIDSAHPGLNNIRDRINQESNSLVLQIGTTLGYFINNNSKRCLLDFQLGFTDRIINKYESKGEVTRALKAGGFKFIVVDLNTHTLDRTPEQTLTNKFRKLLTYVSNNNNLRLLGTDRYIENPNKQSKQRYIPGLAGKIVSGGSYAVFEIM